MKLLFQLIKHQQPASQLVLILYVPVEILFLRVQPMLAQILAGPVQIVLFQVYKIQL